MSELNNLEPNNFEKNNTEQNNTQLNNSEFNTSKKSSNRMLVWFLVVFTILAMLVTALLIYLTNNSEIFGDKNLSKNENNNVQENVPNNDEREDIKDEANLASKLTDMYYDNPIEIENYYYFDGVTKKIENDEPDQDYLEEHEKKCSYIQIKGLKDKEVENKINKEIEDVTKKLLNKYDSSYAILEGNFANVISIAIASEEIGETGEYADAKTLNYRLDTGEQIQFEDLFTNKAYIKTILTQATYEQYMSQYNQIDLDKIDYSKVEANTFEIVNNYINGATKIFYFSYNEIYILIKNDVVVINMSDFYENIAIYKRYLTDKELYENDIKNTNNFVFSSRSFDRCFYSKLEEVKDNLFVDISLYNFSKNEDKNKQDEIIKNMEVVLEKTKNMATENSDKAYILCYQDNTIGGAAGTLTENEIDLYAMSKDYYIEKGKEEIAKANRDYEYSFVTMSYDFENAVEYKYENGEFVLVQEENEE